MDRQLPSIITTGLIAGTLHARHVRHRWLDRATELEWAMISELTTASPYQMRAVMHFLDRVPDRDRAVKAFGQCGPLILDQGLVTLDPDAPGEIHTPLDFAPWPGSLARSLFRPDVIDGAPGPPGRGAAGGRRLDVQLAGLVTGRDGRLARLDHRGRAPPAARQRPRLNPPVRRGPAEVRPRRNRSAVLNHERIERPRRAAVPSCPDRSARCTGHPG